MSPPSHQITQNRANLALVSIVAGILFALAAPEAQAVNKCVDKGGHVSYQETKCPDDMSQRVLKLSKRPSAGAAPVTAADGPEADDTREDTAILALVSIQTGFEGCVGASPGFDQRHADVYSAWRAANATDLARLEQSGRYQLILENGRRQLRASPMGMPGVSEKLARFCEAQFIPALKNMIGK